MSLAVLTGTAGWAEVALGTSRGQRARVGAANRTTTTGRALVVRGGDELGDSRDNNVRAAARTSCSRRGAPPQLRSWGRVDPSGRRRPGRGVVLPGRPARCGRPAMARCWRRRDRPKCAEGRPVEPSRSTERANTARPPRGRWYAGSIRARERRPPPRPPGRTGTGSRACPARLGCRGAGHAGTRAAGVRSRRRGRIGALLLVSRGGWPPLVLERGPKSGGVPRQVAAVAGGRPRNTG